MEKGLCLERSYFYKQMRKVIFLAVLVFAIIGLSTCYYNNEETLYSTNSCDTTNITFSAKIAPIFTANCLRCHGNAVASSNGGGIRLQDYTDVKAHLDRAYGAMSHQEGFFPMPLDMSTKIDECQIAKVRIWKNAGSPNN